MATFTETVSLEPLSKVDLSITETRAVTDEFAPGGPAPSRDAAGVLQSIEQLREVRDLDTLLELVLLRARQLVRADAGTIYLKAGNELYFSFIQNDSLFLGHTAESRYVYSATTLPIDRSSLAGYVAATREPLVIDDVYDIKSGVSYSFNPAYDRKSHYKTTSMLIVPLLSREDALVGVLQLINATDDAGATVPFSYQDRLFATQFARQAADAVDRAKLTRSMVLHLVELSALRDPYETADHANRIGAYSVELYERWATRARVPRPDIRANREIIRTAAMLHDVGKAAISEAILRKEGNLSDAERKRMQLHTIYGARLFKNDDSPWEVMAREIALNHHERWDGTGYPGHTSSIFERNIRVGRPKRRDEIPVSARIVAIADVYDALVTRRVHKRAWKEADVLTQLRAEAGKRFDPSLVEHFLGMTDVIKSIRLKYA
jgi:HD-GYP domain-containing protein (c-di-GMP phosphodiesterase class II)